MVFVSREAAARRVALGTVYIVHHYDCHAQRRADYVERVACRPGPQGAMVQCYIQRKKTGMARLFPTYEIYLKEVRPPEEPRPPRVDGLDVCSTYNRCCHKDAPHTRSSMNTYNVSLPRGAPVRKPAHHLVGCIPRASPGR